VSEGSGLVGADERGVGCCLTRTEDMDEEVFGGRLLHSEARARMAEQVTFWNGDDDQHYGNCQNIGEGGSLLVGSPTKLIRTNAEVRGEDGYQAGSPVPKWTKSTGQ